MTLTKLVDLVSAVAVRLGAVALVYGLVKGTLDGSWAWWQFPLLGLVLLLNLSAVSVTRGAFYRWPRQSEVPTYPGFTTAWRIWLVDETGQLASWSHFSIWPPMRRMMASCDLHAAPARSCSCGIYALKDLPSPHFTSQTQLVYGRVALWGRILEFSKGYRAQYAYPLELFCHDDRVAYPLAVKYGVPVHVGVDSGQLANHTYLLEGGAHGSRQAAA